MVRGLKIIHLLWFKILIQHVQQMSSNAICMLQKTLLSVD